MGGFQHLGALAVQRNWPRGAVEQFGPHLGFQRLNLLADRVVSSRGTHGTRAFPGDFIKKAVSVVGQAAKSPIGQAIGGVLTQGSRFWASRSPMMRAGLFPLKDQLIGVFPDCGRRSRNRHGWLTRSLQDLPVQGKAFTVKLPTKANPLPSSKMRERRCSSRPCSSSRADIAGPRARKSKLQGSQLLRQVGLRCRQCPTKVGQRLSLSLIQTTHRSDARERCGSTHVLRLGAHTMASLPRFSGLRRA